jgi:hypothetical protein
LSQEAVAGSVDTPSVSATILKPPEEGDDENPVTRRLERLRASGYDPCITVLEASGASRRLFVVRLKRAPVFENSTALNVETSSGSMP